jgi:Nitronate monooxygenase
MSTPVCELLGIERPIVQAPMAAIPRLAAAVSNAGALGMVTLTWSDDAGAVVRETAALTTRPFGGNLILTEDHHRRLDQALDAGLRIVSFMLGDPSGYIEPPQTASGQEKATSSRTSPPAKQSFATSQRRRWPGPPVISKRSRCGPDRASHSPDSHSQRRTSLPSSPPACNSRACAGACRAPESVSAGAVRATDC